MALSWGNSQQMAWSRVVGKISYFVQVSAYYVRPSVAYSWPITANWLRCLWAEIESGGETEGGGGGCPDRRPRGRADAAGEAQDCQEAEED